MAIEFIFRVVYIVSFFFLLKLIWSLIRGIWVVFFRPAKNLKEYGTWAIVTGCTDGLGKAIAFELASKGLNIVLVGRNPEKLKATSFEIHRRYKFVETKDVVIDFLKSSGTEISKLIEEGIEGLDIGILINVAGLNYPTAGYFHEVDEEVMQSLLKVNIDSVTWMTKSVLPIMIRKRKGAIVNLGAGSSAVIPSSPLFTLYASTKCYMDQLSRSLYVEYKKYGIDVQVQVPAYCITRMTLRIAAMKEPSLFIPTAEHFARASVRMIGYEARCSPYWAHALQWGVSQYIPDTFLDANRLAEGIRRRSLRNPENHIN
ncbi:very-long-chain 3-oxoacyl-CoA reductase-like protein At1g24470 [Pistacia vera]|uniref:very-long-chain 3-oxoacyl-CoA reductase-like protein At1g24470 n=1 Tax=Pistacia vera TaxID=55513 RepID=UPI001263735F|nr:very-long-chain 3-oxoacyl-CoA reductase-like protein At1g24470 [Pistacia vera]